MADTATTEKDPLLEGILNELDIMFKDENFEKKIEAILKRGKTYLSDKYGSEIDFAKDDMAMEMLVSYCRYGRSNAIEQFKKDFAADLTALALRGAIAQQEAAAESGATE